MGLIDRLARLWYVWSWRVRFWWFDTPSGESARKCASAVCWVVGLASIANGYFAGPNEGSVQAIIWWVWALVVIAAAAAVSLASMPKQQPPAAQEGEPPSVEDGKSVIHHFGERWIENEFILAWKQMGTEPIKTKGGKK